MVDVLAELGWMLPHADRTHLKSLAREVYDSLAHLNPQTFKDSRRKTELGDKIAEFLRRKDGIVFPQHTVLLSRATGLIEGTCITLVPERSMLDLVRPRLGRLFSVRTRLKHLREELAEVWRAYRHLPERIDSALAKRQEFPLAPILAALLLVAAIQLTDSTARIWATCAAGAALLLSLRRR